MNLQTATSSRLDTLLTEWSTTSRLLRSCSILCRITTGARSIRPLSFSICLSGVATSSGSKANCIARAAKLLLAIEAWRLEHSALPDSLDALMGVYFDTVPRDPFSGTPFEIYPQGAPVSLGGTHAWLYPFGHGASVPAERPLLGAAVHRRLPPGGNPEPLDLHRFFPIVRPGESLSPEQPKAPLNEQSTPAPEPTNDEPEPAPLQPPLDEDKAPPPGEPQPHEAAPNDPAPIETVPSDGAPDDELPPLAQ